MYFLVVLGLRRTDAMAIFYFFLLFKQIGNIYIYIYFFFLLLEKSCNEMSGVNFQISRNVKLIKNALIILVNVFIVSIIIFSLYNF